MLNGKLISANEIIRRLYRDSALTSELPYQDALEWSMECVELLNVKGSFTRELIVLEVHDFKAKLPCNYKQMIQAGGATASGMVFSMEYSGHNFHPVKSVQNNTSLQLTNSQLIVNGNLIDTSDPVGVDTAGNPVFNYISSTTLSSISGEQLELMQKGIPNKATYYLNEDYIFTSFKTGFVILSYLAYPFDCDGFPKIPDEPKFKLAVQWYIQERIDYILWRQDLISDKLFQYTTQQRDFYVAAAQTAGIMPNLDEMESLRKLFNNLVLPNDLHKKAFRR